MKFAINPNETNRLTFMLDDSEQRSRGQDLSYTLAPLKTEPDKPEKDSRHTNDRSHRRNLAVAFENYDSNFFYDSLKMTLSHQSITQTAQTDEWCDGGLNCVQYSNPAGLHLENNKWLDKHNKEVSLYRGDPNKGEANTIFLKDSQGKLYNDYTTTKDLWLDCSMVDCNQKITTFKDNWDNGDWKEENKLKDQSFKKYTDPDTGKTYAKPENDNIIIPSNPGFSEGFYRKRHLITKSNDIRLDFSKAVDLWSTHHELSYGGSYTHTKKSMVNQEYFRVIPGTPVMWWAQSIELDWNSKKKQCDGSWGSPTSKLVCGNSAKDLEPFSFLIPVVTDTKAIYFSDSVRFNSWFSMDLGYRYDHIRYKPEYEEGKTARIPDEMMKGVFIKPPKTPKEPKHYDMDKYYDHLDKLYKETIKNGGTAIKPEKDKMNTYYKPLKALYDAELEKIKNNPAENRAYLTEQKRKMDHHSYSVGANFDPLSFMRVQLKYANSFRAPTSDEMYFTFKHPDFSIKPNNDLRPETAKTKEVALTFYKNRSFLTLNAFRTDYKNFIDLAFQGQEYFTDINGDKKGLGYLVYQNVNQQKAKVTGVEVSGKMYLQDLFSPLADIHLGYKFSHQQGRVYRQINAPLDAVKKMGEVPINAISPDKHVFTIGYANESGRFGVDLYWTHVAAKHARDTYNQFHSEEGQKDTYSKYLSPSYNIFDIISFVKYKKLLVQTGVYNLLNREYLTWDNARSIRSIGTSNRICQTGSVKAIGCQYPNQGIERFYSPGRNYRVDVALTF